MSWETAKLGEFALNRGGSLNPEKFPDETFDLYSIPSYDSGSPEVITGSEIGSSKKIVEPGDVLLSKIVPHIKRVWIVGGNRGRRQIASGEWIVYRTNKVYGEYLRFFLFSENFRKRFMGTVKGVGGSLLRATPNLVDKLEIPLPPLKTQKQIAAILEKADQLRKDCQKMEQELNSLAQSVFIDMFGDPVSNPKGWEVKKCGDLCRDISVGVVVKPASYYVESGVPALRSLNVRENGILDEKMVYFSIEANQGAVSKSRIYTGDVLVVRSGQPGRAAVVPEKYDGCNCIDVLIARPDNKLLESQYLTFFLNSEGGRRLVLKEERGQVQKHLNVKALSDAEIPLPGIDLQRKFLKYYKKLNAQHALANTGFSSIEGLFYSLMQRAFKGELNLTQAA